MSIGCQGIFKTQDSGSSKFLWSRTQEFEETAFVSNYGLTIAVLFSDISFQAVWIFSCIGPMACHSDWWNSRLDQVPDAATIGVTMKAQQMPDKCRMLSNYDLMVEALAEKKKFYC